MPTPPRPSLGRTLSWPPTPRLITYGPAVSQVHTSGTQCATPRAQPKNGPEEADGDFDEHPEEHFLSPMYEYEDWASDSDEGGDDDFEWDAGITDFALFHTDRRHAQESNERLDGRWNEFMSRQQSALQRAVERSRCASQIDTTKPPIPVEEVPGLTPDSSPELHDDLEIESYHGQGTPRPTVPGYLTVIVTPQSPEDRTIHSNEDLPCFLELSVQRKHARRKLERPGLRHARTLSGKAHSWRRPSWEIHTLGEEPETERSAEQGAIRRVGSR
ncbi:hypothetical protein BAUCODRAFT_26061 [Baudoinia panamericana UAMH 10762]|uniref:Uncharacterized protein n=1 Tax=Baudoinia panamericana (strain UAMH 10762) TaxID=717646 RepID=M2N4V8_BAUPA|nr:uncharacterized protein BAUCODRAFT_26061 [Baudoinia panamericana UAMH 10762]EMC93795.1 hypothetical protein BAUCODRAFT_26061 [Baudoinia panamericana UAMH 10762]